MDRLWVYKIKKKNLVQPYSQRRFYFPQNLPFHQYWMLLVIGGWNVGLSGRLRAHFIISAKLPLVVMGGFYMKMPFHHIHL